MSKNRTVCMGKGEYYIKRKNMVLGEGLPTLLCKCTYIFTEKLQYGRIGLNEKLFDCFLTSRLPP